MRRYGPLNCLVILSVVRVCPQGTLTLPLAPWVFATSPWFSYRRQKRGTMRKKKEASEKLYKLVNMKKGVAPQREVKTDMELQRIKKTCEGR